MAEEEEVSKAAAAAPSRRRRQSSAKPKPQALAQPEAPQPEVTADGVEASPATTPRPRQRRRRPPNPAVAKDDANALVEVVQVEPPASPEPDVSGVDPGADPEVKIRPGRRRKRSGGRGRDSRDEFLPSSHPRTMLIGVGKERTQIAVLEKRELVEHYVARNEDRSIVGNIYVGRVQNVLPGMEAAFLDIGESRNAVLYAGEVGFDEELDGPRPRIETMLKSGQAVLAQVTKDPMGSKGARLTTELSIAGRFLVLVPEAGFLGISRRLPDDERRRLKELTAALRPKEQGLIVRTAAEGASEQDIQRDVHRLERIWGEVQTKAKKAKPPKELYREPDLAIRVVRDLFTTDVEKIIVDDKDLFDELRAYVEELMPDLLDRIELHSETLGLFEKHHVVEQIRKAIDRKVWLKSGGNIVIDRTEAMTVIDVNSGKFVGKTSLEETVLKTNLEASEEVAKQLRLRDMG
ncbi:MAG: Rne/Rng family ribonuclease, partial [Actinomycetota bacterium]